MMSAQQTVSTVEILERLVSFDTTSRNSNHALIDWISAYLEGLGVAYTISLDPTGEKANLHAVVGPDVAGGFVLSGHVDTVPVDGQAWSTDPFQLTERGGRLYGRGSTDMKGFVASALAAVPTILEARLPRPVHLFITYDEEVTCNGARVLIEQMQRDGQAPALCIVGEPSMLRPVIAHKGRLAAAVTVRGRAGHASVPDAGVNAVQAAARAIAFIADEADRLAAEGRRVPGFDPPWSTLSTGHVEGGSALNIIPEHARFEVEWRVVPGDRLEDGLARLRDHVAQAIVPRMRAVDPSCGIEITQQAELPPLALAHDHALVSLVQSLTGANETQCVSYATEAGLYQQAGIASIVCGPGDIAQAHQADEFIARSQLDACDAFLGRLIGQLSR